MIIERIKQPIDPDMYIVPQSTPIVFFGNYDKARACTISLNPSNKEFVDDRGVLLDNKRKERLCSRKKINRLDSDVLTDEEANTVLRYCNDYFNINPLNNWFKPFDYFINQYGNYSYYDGSCVHLDLFQWATYEKWDKLPVVIRQKHVNNDLPILKYLLQKDFEVMFLNGKTVVENVSSYLNLSLKIKTTSFKKASNENVRLKIWYGKYNKTNVIGWNLYLQSAAVGGYDNKRLLCETIKKTIQF